MRRLSLVAGTVVVTVGISAIALADGGPPPPDPPAPAAGTVVAHGQAGRAVVIPARKTNRTIRRAVVAARIGAYPAAVDDAGRTARSLAAASGLRLGDAVGVAQDVGPLGWYDESSGRFGPGRWCGVTSFFSYVKAKDGSTKRILHRRRGCRPPDRVDVRLTVTFSAAR